MIFDGVVTGRKDGLEGFGAELVERLRKENPAVNFRGTYRQDGEFDKYVVVKKRFGIPTLVATIVPQQIVQDPKGRRVGLYTDKMYSRDHSESVKKILGEMGGRK